LRALAPAILALATLLEKTAAQQAQQLALADAFREAAYRFELASREPGCLARSGLLFGPAAEQARLIAEAEAYRKGADDMARGMSRSPFFEGAVPADVVAAIRQVDEQVFRLGAPCCYEQSLPDGAGPARVYLTNKLLYRQPGQPDRLIGFSTDITELRSATKQLTASEEHFRLLAANVTDVVFRLSHEGRILWVSPSLTAALGWRPEQWIGHLGTEFLVHGGASDTYRANMTTLAAGGSTRARDQVIASDGSFHWVETLASPYRNASGQLDGIAASFRTIDQQVAAEQQLQKLATTDGLTGIANRRHLDVLIGQAIQRADRYGETLCLILCDIDNFKAINDQHGHHSGDQVLITFAARIQRQLRSSDAFGRWGGEEFLILVPHCSADAALCLAHQLRELVAAKPFPQAGRVTASFGVAERLPEEPEEAWLQRVDAALYAAKAAGRNQVCGD
jgi:diguanylate cyclase (GGDEF)-like protein/PAS domain S-box-containing protein